MTSLDIHVSFAARCKLRAASVRLLAAIGCVAVCCLTAAPCAAAEALDLARLKFSDDCFDGFPDAIADVYSDTLVYSFGSAETEQAARRSAGRYTRRWFYEPDWKLLESYSCRRPAENGREVLACFAPDLTAPLPWPSPVQEFEWMLAGPPSLPLTRTVNLSIWVDREQLMVPTGTFDRALLDRNLWPDEACHAVITGRMPMPLVRFRFRSRPPFGSELFAAIARSALNAKPDYSRRLGGTHAHLVFAKPKSKPSAMWSRNVLLQPTRELSDDTGRDLAKLLD